MPPPAIRAPLRLTTQSSKRNMLFAEKQKTLCNTPTSMQHMMPDSVSSCGAALIIQDYKTTKSHSGTATAGNHSSWCTDLQGAWGAKMTRSTVQLLVQQHRRRAIKPCILTPDDHPMQCTGDLVGTAGSTDLRWRQQTLPFHPRKQQQLLIKAYSRPTATCSTPRVQPTRQQAPVCTGQFQAKALTPLRIPSSSDKAGALSAQCASVLPQPLLSWHGMRCE
jgi:hypothetical protein